MQTIYILFNNLSDCVEKKKKEKKEKKYSPSMSLTKKGAVLEAQSE